MANHSHIPLPNPQLNAPCLFAPWKAVAQSVGIPEVQEEPSSNLRSGVSHAVELLQEPVQREFRAAFEAALEAIPALPAQVETRTTCP